MHKDEENAQLLEERILGLLTVECGCRGVLEDVRDIWDGAGNYDCSQALIAIRETCERHVGNAEDYYHYVDNDLYKQLNRVYPDWRDKYG